MSDPNTINFKYPSWQKPYAEALIEIDKGKLQKRIAAAEAAIQRRLQELSQSPADRAERQAILDAQAALRILKREAPGSPGGEKK